MTSKSYCILMAQRQTLDNETEPTVSQAEIDALDIRVLENRENEMVFTISQSVK